MIPRVAQSGRSFKGAALYYLHDKKAETSERVAWSQTMNIPTDDPNRAVAHMIDTATHADQLKQAAGLKAGRKLEKPVYVYSLAWHPDEAPSKAEQVDAARETLSILGLSSHQALIVAHTDTDHPHVHVIVNRVDPETGRATVMNMDQIKLSKWAEDYERRHGKIWVETRVQNNAERAQGQWVKHRAEQRRQWQEWKKATTGKMWEDFKAEKAKAYEKRKGQYDALWRQRENRLAARKAEIKELFKPKWREKFKKQRKELADFDHGMFERIGFALSRKDQNAVFGVLQAILSDGQLRDDFIRKQEEERKALGFAQFLAVKDASREIDKAWKYDRDQLYALHRQQGDERYKKTKEATDAVWKKEFDEYAPQPKMKRGEFKKQVEEENEKQSIRRSRTRKPRPR